MKRYQADYQEIMPRSSDEIWILSLPPKIMRFILMREWEKGAIIFEDKDTAHWGKKMI